MLVLRNLLALVTLALLFTLSSAQYTLSVSNSASGSKCTTAVSAKLNACNTGCLNSFNIVESSNGKGLVFKTFINAACSGEYESLSQFTCAANQKIPTTSYIVSCNSTPSSNSTTDSDSSSGSTVMIGLASSLLFAFATLLALF
ncbi:actin binding protein [Dictyostelium discoideum AX4]|uniref:Ponticulin n=1 Tax=Dictyostelium discoideum TaxID=44689 RepID=PONA_DICDI|nr:actin binding protein [Dictyostelium discoideum AX4]P54660.1 RecName: Full=Ponticulin; Flags: Precursor [Dictyostelium discoideum]EAL60573.1 actin binding protein [Dictyostelium discoideum AX4]CAA85296.1 Ponticulin [Dictyostelium discoideum]|eukprot:XP_629065.1 actin binding protein [Dictyostelium discoideum AX4]